MVKWIQIQKKRSNYIPNAYLIIQQLLQKFLPVFTTVYSHSAFSDRSRALHCYLCSVYLILFIGILKNQNIATDLRNIYGHL